MKIKEVTSNNITSYLKLDDYDSMTELEKQEIDIVKEAAFAFIVSETGMPSDEVEDKDDLTVAYLCLCQDMYDHRAVQVDKNTVNSTVDAILSMHRVNLL